VNRPVVSADVSRKAPARLQGGRWRGFGLQIPRCRAIRAVAGLTSECPFAAPVTVRAPDTPYRVPPQSTLSGKPDSPVLRVYRMPRFSFHMRHGKFWNACTETAFESTAEAREEAMAIDADLARAIFVGPAIDCEWHMEVTDENGRSIFRLRLMAESPEQERAVMTDAEIEPPQLAASLASTRDGVTTKKPLLGRISDDFPSSLTTRRS
jgi:hypothetical protein